MNIHSACVNTQKAQNTKLDISWNIKSFLVRFSLNSPSNISSNHFLLFVALNE